MSLSPPPNLCYNLVDRPKLDDALLGSVQNMKFQLYLDQCLVEGDAPNIFRCEMRTGKPTVGPIGILNEDNSASKRDQINVP